MTSCTFEDIFNQFYIKAKAYDIASLNEAQSEELLCGWLHAAASKPYVRKLFSNFTIDDETHKVNFEMKYTIDDDTDLDFVLDIFGLGMIMEWYRPYINNYNNVAQVYGSKEERFFSQSSHFTGLQTIAKSVKKEQRQMISDRGSAWNSYLDGEK